eukprot:TRINITY_DN24281_c3_g1_i1.p1 TRINITY_DN24281_c3_g1~~TRINITY_DN24281_c3_g1_i1.p1  ORF type:complete len:487 (+),score=145.82 TRINITY_DN24281_c3_g1_i1:66-1463(+)
MASPTAAPTGEDSTTIPFGNELGSIAFLAGTWLLERLLLKCGGSPLLGNLAAGILLGPSFADIVPYSDGWRLLGKLGVLVLIVDSSLQIDLAQVRACGLRAFVAAAAGVAGPVGLAMLVVNVGFKRPWKAALAAGAALAPTSLGFSAKLLQEFGRLQTPLGQLICVAAVMDDVLSLCLLAEIKALKGDSPGGWDIARPLVASLGSIVVGAVLALSVFPSVLPSVLRRLPAKETDEVARRCCLIALVFITATALAFAAALAGSSDLLGTFAGVLPFAAFPEVVEAWQRSTKPLVQWGSRLFFAATVGFGCPKLRTGSGNLLNLAALGKGAALGVVAVVGKFAVAPFSSPLTFHGASEFGWAMQGRGEFSFLLADEAAEEGLFVADTADHPSVVWGLLVACLAAPFAFRCVLSSGSQPAESSEAAAATAVPTGSPGAALGAAAGPAALSDPTTGAGSPTALVSREKG